MKLRILHTNDVHSNYETFARAVTLIKELKDANTLLLDGGDFADFKSIELQGTRGTAALELLEEAGYDALTIGNNEMFNGIETLEHMATNSTIPFISNNLVKKDQIGIQGVVRSTILIKNGMRILITGSSPDLGVFNDGLGIHVYEYKKMIEEEIGRNKGNYDLCILLSHIGTEADELLTAAIPEIDIIISAHDHQLYPKAKIANSVIMNSAGNYAEHVGVIELEAANGQVTLIHSETLSTRDVPMDLQILEILKQNKAKAIAALSKPLYKLDQPLWHDVIEENPIANLVADGLRDMMQCHIGLINSGIVNAGAFDFLSHKKLIEICPSPLNPTSFELQGKDLKEAIEQSLDAQVCLSDGRGPGFRGKFAGKLHVSGAEVVHDSKSVQEIWINGEPIEENRWYTVASSDYLQRGSGYPSLANNRNASYRAEEIRDVIQMYGDKKEFLDMATEKRWRVTLNTYA
ncbi:2',3'-cyclic-nucleotide 2'-phosphodiesterase (5'-nucleotidase family) [Planomicrobium soli]|uniref:2',3'-cyclic-nucleotide 2'-phosphodiesterase (5'-nucleotidase family) n=1 Tax=Planomicrobium soli TaxID=1176648 RepID=A0A2P8H5J5_9BACL|nr:5'-nucleotidase C-terminal domain-containing protein [Planomicrobium soli]PSL41505.1 2',3'-cyclic-nucleotide 2'-phosphodiesterase (5'-nucleotidase family) [Planomicrobium soli]